MNILTKIRLINELNLKELKQGVSFYPILTFEMTSKRFNFQGQTREQLASTV